MIRLSLAMAWVELRKLLRDRRAFLGLFILPILLTSILSFALSGEFGGKNLPAANLVVVNQDAGSAGAQLIGFLSKQKAMLNMTTSSSIADARNQLSHGKADVAVLIPADYSQNVAANRPTSMDVESGLNKGTDASIVQGYLSAFGTQLGVYHVMQSTLQKGPTQPLQLQFNTTSSTLHPVTSGSYYAIGMMVMFLLSNAISRSTNMARERDSDRYKRMIAAPTSRLALAGGHVISSFLILLLQGAVVLFSSRYILGVHLGPIGQTALLVASYSLAIAGLSVALGSWIRSANILEGIGGIGSNIAAVLGGSIFPIYGFPQLMKWIAKALPNGQAVTGLVDSVIGISMQGLLIPIVYLIILGLILGLAGSLRYGRTA